MIQVDYIDGDILSHVIKEQSRLQDDTTIQKSLNSTKIYVQ